jgi:hypothetical protein
MDASRFDRLTRRLGRRTTRRAAVGTVLAGLAAGSIDHVAAGQASPTPAPSASPPVEGEKPVFMFVETFSAGRAEANPAAGTPTTAGTPTPGGGAAFLLTLEGHTGLTVYFSDRPDRVVGATPTGAFLDGFDFSPGNPPNAALVSEFRAGQGVVVLELLTPSYDANTGTLIYGAEVLEGYAGENLTPVLADQVAERLPAEFGPSALFIDDCPAITTCWHWVVGPTHPFVLPLAPIPGGPYGQCWNATTSSCQPCDYTRASLDGLCNDTYSECDGNCFAAPAPA